MTDFSLYSLEYFLKELEKNLIKLDEVIDKEMVYVGNMFALHQGMSSVYKNWNNYLIQKNNTKEKENI